MKKLLFMSLIIVAAICCKAQTPKLFVTDTAKIKQQKLLFPNNIIGKTQKGTVYALPQDKMPCIVPDSNLLAIMPNAYNGSKYRNTIPNPYNKRITPDTLLQLLKPSGSKKVMK